MFIKIKKYSLPIICVMFISALLFFVVSPNKIVLASSETTSETAFNNIINVESFGKKTWGNGTVNYSYDEQKGASLKFDNPNVVGMGKIVYGNICTNETVLTFKATVDTSDDWQWNYVVFRGDEGLDNFTALAFRKGGGHIMLLSRVDGIWYSYDNSDAKPGNIILGTATTKNCELGTSEILKNLSGNVIDLSIESSWNYVKVYSGQTLIYESPLTLELPSAAGIFYYSAANSNNNLSLTNVKCFCADYTSWNNAVDKGNVIYSPYGGGGAECLFSDNGATLKAGSSINGTAVLTSPYMEGQTVQTYSFTLDTPPDSIYSFYSILLRADDNLDNYLVFQIRRAFGQCMMYGKLNGYNCAYAINEPFESKNTPIFPIGRTNNGDTIPQGTRFDLTIISDNHGITIYNGKELLYQVIYSRLALTDKNGNLYDLDISDIPRYISELSPRIGIFGGGEYGYINAEFYNVNCYYSGEKKENLQNKTFLNGITYNSVLIDGFSRGTFEYDYTLSKNAKINKEGIKCVAGSGVENVEIVWGVDEVSGFEQAALILTTETTKRKYVINFVRYEPPEPFVREKWEKESSYKQEKDGGGCASTVGVSSASLFASVIVLSLVFFVKRNKAR